MVLQYCIIDIIWSLINLSNICIALLSCLNMKGDVRKQPLTLAKTLLVPLNELRSNLISAHHFTFMCPASVEEPFSTMDSAKNQRHTPARAQQPTSVKRGNLRVN